MAFLGKGTQFLREDDGTPGTYNAAARLIELGDISPTRDTTDNTAHDSPAGHKEFLAALKDYGEVSLTLDFLPANTENQKLRADFDVDTPHSYRIIWPDGDSTTATFDALVIGYGVQTPLEDKVRRTFNLKISGAIVWS